MILGQRHSKMADTKYLFRILIKTGMLYESYNNGNIVGGPYTQDDLPYYFRELWELP